ncbi:MAG TPA: hypothetical protein ENI06_10225 [Spirochaetales bacterium]|nr:hypothetical protein [Spirochaetales bacterium]
MNRPRPMGRDFYDAVYLMGKTRTNLAYMQSKIGISNFKELQERLLDRCAELDLEGLAADVRPFLIKPGDIESVRLFPQALSQHLDVNDYEE